MLQGTLNTPHTINKFTFMIITRDCEEVAADDINFRIRFYI